MQLLLLPGNSLSNKSWSKTLEAELSPFFDQTKTIEYANWKDDDFGKVIDFPTELAAISQAIENWDHYFVLAKSVGTALCMKAVQDKIISPEKCVFVGLPLLWLAKNNIPIDSYINTYSIPTLFIQEQSDPLADADMVQAYLAKFPNLHYSFLVVEGDNHQYANIQEIVSHAVNFLSLK